MRLGDQPSRDGRVPNAFTARTSGRSSEWALLLFMPGLVPGTHVLRPCKPKDVDGRDTCGHDDYFLGRFAPSFPHADHRFFFFVPFFAKIVFQFSL